jgi:hypothetical protein
LCAQQVETKPDTQKPAAATEGANSGVQPDRQPPPNGHRRSHGNEGHQQEMKPVTYIGLLTREVPVELRAQLTLAEGFGLLVEEVLPESPAKAAGLKVYDVLVKFEDQQLVNMEQFMSLVRSKKKGDVVQLDVISGGKETKVPVTLGDHQVAAHDRQAQQDHPDRAHPYGMSPFNGHPFPGGVQRGFQNQANALHEQVERFQQEMREYQERIQQWSKGGATGPMPQAPMLNLPGAEHQPQGGGRHRYGHPPETGISIPPGTNLQRFNYSKSSSTANATRRDDSGEYSIKNEDGKKTFIVRPNNGKEQNWPINTDAERQSVPQEFRSKLQEMDAATSGVHIEIKPGTGSPGPQEGSNTPSLQPVKGRATSA